MDDDGHERRYVNISLDDMISGLNPMIKVTYRLVKKFLKEELYDETTRTDWNVYDADEWDSDDGEWNSYMSISRGMYGSLALIQKTSMTDDSFIGRFLPLQISTILKDRMRGGWYRFHGILPSED